MSIGASSTAPDAIAARGMYMNSSRDGQVSPIGASKPLACAGVDHGDAIRTAMIKEMCVARDLYIPSSPRMI
jgi:hypothetical protein